MPKSLSISEARARLPELVRYLRRSPHDVVYIEHRDMDERLALITESRLRLLESVRLSVERPGSTFELLDSMVSDLTDDELEIALNTMKEEQTLLSEAKTAET